MREILFRAKTIKNVHWIWGDLFHTGTEPSDGEFAISYWDDEDGWMNENVQPGTIGQFTGLIDNRGIRVFEGDILRVKEFENLLIKEFLEDADEFDLFTLDEIKGKKRAEYISPVRWEEGGFDVSTNGEYFDMWVATLFGDMKRSSPVFEFEVIGNIYDNPGLIDVKDWS